MQREMLRENRIHGNPMYPVSVYPSVEQLNGNSVLESHWHEEMEFIVVEQGSAVFQTDMVYTEVNEGEALFVNSGELHAGYLQKSARCVFSAVVFHPDILHSRTQDTVQTQFIDPFISKKLVPPPTFAACSPGSKRCWLHCDTLSPAMNRMRLPVNWRPRHSSIA